MRTRKGLKMRILKDDTGKKYKGKIPKWGKNLLDVVDGFVTNFDLEDDVRVQIARSYDEFKILIYWGKIHKNFYIVNKTFTIINSRFQDIDSFLERGNADDVINGHIKGVDLVKGNMLAFLIDAFAYYYHERRMFIPVCTCEGTDCDHELE